ncbi:hypothetical protein KL937_004215 [Ogataea polymorpha]|nr:hypothetical protein KL937_004215 [Ogataea polymorpha]KAG7930857.1 hypothetical protein KL934_004483 [Ogataea polymorpha]KAG7932607.1 hypothetical protein KL904_004398 [Ogataea polymorpha]
MDPNPSNRKLERNSDGDAAQIINSRPTLFMKTASSMANLSVASIMVVSLRKWWASFLENHGLNTSRTLARHSIASPIQKLRKHEDFDDEEFDDRPARCPVDVAAGVASGDPQQAQRRAKPVGRLGNTEGRHFPAGPTPEFPRPRLRQKYQHQHKIQRVHEHRQRVDIQHRQRQKRPSHWAQSEPHVENSHQNSQVRLPLRFINNVDQIAVGQPYGDGQRAGQRAQKVHRQTPRWREPCLICLENQQFETPGHDVNEDVVHEQRLASIHVAQASYLDAHKNGADTTNQVLPPLDARAQLLACWRAAADHPARMLPVVVVARPVEREGELLALLDAYYERRDEHHGADHEHRRSLVPYQSAVVSQILQHEIHVRLVELVVAVAGRTRAAFGHAVSGLANRNHVLQHVVLEIRINHWVIELHYGAERAVTAIPSNVLPFWRAEQSVCLLVHSNARLEMQLNSTADLLLTVIFFIASPIFITTNPMGDEPAANKPSRATVNPVCVATVTRYFDGHNDPALLSLMVDDIVYVLNTPNSRWWDGILIDPIGNVTRGWFPPSHTRIIQQGTPLQPSVSTARDERRTLESLNFPKNISFSSTASAQTPHRESFQSTRSGDRSQSVTMASAEEINSYFSQSTSHPSFNFLPVWVPEITQDDEFVYHNSALNVYAKELPLISADYVDHGSALEKTDLSRFNGLDVVPIDAKETAADSESQAERTYDQPQNRDTIVDCLTDTNGKLWHSPDMFYFSPMDVTNWPDLYKKFRYLVNMCLEAISKNSRELFLVHLNSISETVTLFHLASNMGAKDLERNGVADSVRENLRKMTSSLSQLAINGNLHFVGSKHSQYYLGGDDAVDEEASSTDEPDHGSQTSHGSETFLRRAERDTVKLIKRAGFLKETFLRLRYSNQVDAEYLPLVYPRFFKGRFHAGNFANPFDDLGSSLHSSESLFIDPHSHKNNVLLDDEAIEYLTDYKTKACEILENVVQVLSTQIPSDVKYKNFIEDRNLNIVTLIYHSVPSLNRFLNILESIDFTIFIMVNRLARKERLRNERVAEDDDPESANRLFYETTSKQLEPVLTEFVELKQSFHDTLSDLIMDAQNITVDDPEVFEGMKEEEMFYDKAIMSLKTEQFSRALVANLNEKDFRDLNDGEYLYDSNLKLRATISKALEQFDLVIMSTTQLKEERQSILNYCTRLMNTDFSVASLFVAERHNTMISSLSQSEYSYGRHRSRDTETELPWFLDADDEERSVIFDINGIKGGPPGGLVSRLVNPTHDNDDEFKETMLAMFVTFMTPVAFFDALMDRYNVQMPEGLSYEEYSIWVEKKLKRQREEVLRTFAKLFSTAWLVQYSSSELRSKWDVFVDSNNVDVKLAQLGRLVMAMKTQDEWFAEFGHGNPEPKPFEGRPPVPLMLGKTLRNTNKLRLRDIDSMEFARQITLIQFELFNKIDKFDLLARSYRFSRIFKHPEPVGSKSIANFVRNCNVITHFVIYMILRQRDIQARAENIKYFIIVADKLLRLRNYSSMTAIISGLSSTSISRLKKTWVLVPKHLVANFEKMDQLMSIGKNYSEYRSILKFVNEDPEPCLPFLGMYLSDLRFLTDGNSDYLHNNRNLVNFGKRLSIYRTIQEVIKFNSKAYHFEKIDELWSYFYDMWEQLPDDDKLYNISLKLEPMVSLVNQQDNEKRARGVDARVFKRNVPARL